MPVQAGVRAVGRVGMALGSLNEVPRDAKTFSDLYAIGAQLEWQAFNNSVQRELRRAGRRIPRKVRERERAEHEKWAKEQVMKRTHQSRGWAAHSG